MAATSCSPSSLQLRLAMNCKSHKAAPAISIRFRVIRGRDSWFRLRCADDRSDNRVRRRYSGSSWIVSSSAADNFSGWSDLNGDDQPVESQKQWPAGIVGAGVAGVVLVTGLSFAALSLSKRSVPRSTQQMEPLTTHEEAMLGHDNEDDKDECNKIEERNVMQDDTSLKSNTEVYEPSSENKVGESNEISSVEDVEYATRLGERTNSASIQEDLQPESTSETEKNLFDSEPGELSNTTNFHSDYQAGLPGSKVIEDSEPSLDFSNSNIYKPSESVAVSISVSSQLEVSEPQIVPKNDMDTISKESLEFRTSPQVSTQGNKSSSLEGNYMNENGLFRKSSMSASEYSFASEQDIISEIETNGSPTPSNSFASAGIPAPSALSAAHQVLPGKVLIPAVVDQVQGQALAALQVLKVIEADAQPSDLCTRRQYARWLVVASSSLSRNTLSKVYPAMFIEDVTELAFDDITPDDPDFSFIQGLAEAGLISSKLSNRDLLSSPDECQSPFYFSPESPLSRQDLVSWKMALEKRQLPEPNKKILYQLSGFRDIDKINPDAWPALIADLSAGDQGIISLAFGCTRLFQPIKPVTKAQAAIALATGEASDIVSEELARIEAESMAEAVVSAHNALVAEVEKDINASFEKELSMEKEKISAVEKMAEEARCELERLRAEREEDNMALMKERATIESEMEVLTRLRHEVEEQLQSLMSDKVQVSYEKERISKLQKEAENEKQEISRLQYELEVERKALSMARAWAEDEAKRAQEQAKALEEARDRWERHGIKVVVDDDLREESSAGVTWLTAAKQFSVEGTVNRGENLVDKLKLMANEVRGKSREVIDNIVAKILFLISILKEWASEAGTRTKKLKDATIQKRRGSIQELQQGATEFTFTIMEKTRGSMQEFQQNTAEFSSAVKEGVKRIAGECREGVEKLTQKFKS